jgi:hypothetical protein
LKIFSSSTSLEMLGILFIIFYLRIIKIGISTHFEQLSMDQNKSLKTRL